MRTHLLLTLGAAIVVAIIAREPFTLQAQTSAPGKSHSCEPDKVDSSRYTMSPLYRNCDVDVPAKVKRQSDPPYNFPIGLGCATTELTFMVDTTGKWIPDTHAVVYTDDEGYANVLIKSLTAWRYEPAMFNGKPVTQLVFVSLSRKNGRVPFSVGRLKPEDMLPGPPPKTEVCVSSTRK